MATIRHWLGAAAAAAIACGPLAGTQARAHVVPVADMVRGIEMTRRQCDAIAQTVWVQALGRDFCIRYYLSTAGGIGLQAAVFLQGDKPWRLSRRDWQFTVPPDAKDVNTADLRAYADGLSRQTGAPAIYLARPGVDGSSGHHNIRHTMLELHAVNAALDAIATKHGFTAYHLIGQSGGARIAGGLLGLRSDLGCTVIGAGRLSLSKRPLPARDPVYNFFNAADAIPLIAQSRARIILVTDPADRKVAEADQTRFVQMLRQAGRGAEQLFVQATDGDRHGVAGYARAAAKDCMRGAPADEIARNVASLVERRLAAKARSEARAAAPAATSQDAPAAVSAAPAAPALQSAAQLEGVQPGGWITRPAAIPAPRAAQ